MGKKKKDNNHYQGDLFATLEPPDAPAPKPNKVAVTRRKVAQPSYAWQPVTTAHKGTVMVVMNEEVTVLGVREEEDCIFLAYVDPASGKKIEQLYNHQDFVYVKQ
jgi:hypothetical protein